MQLNVPSKNCAPNHNKEIIVSNDSNVMVGFHFEPNPIVYYYIEHVYIYVVWSYAELDTEKVYPRMYSNRNV